MPDAAANQAERAVRRRGVRSYIRRAGLPPLVYGKPFINLCHYLLAPQRFADEGMRLFLEPAALRMVRQNGNQFISEIDGDAVQAIDGRVGLLVRLLIGVSVMTAFDVVARAFRRFLASVITAVIQRGSRRLMRATFGLPNIQDRDALARLRPLDQ